MYLGNKFCLHINKFPAGNFTPQFLKLLLEKKFFKIISISHPESPYIISYGLDKAIWNKKLPQSISVFLDIILFLWNVWVAWELLTVGSFGNALLFILRCSFWHWKIILLHVLEAWKSFIWNDKFLIELFSWLSQISYSDATINKYF